MNETKNQVSQPTNDAPIVSRWSGAENIFSDRPAEGTVLGTLSPELLSLARKRAIEFDASKLHKELSRDEAIKLSEEHRNLWVAICKELDIPYAWSISYEWTTGKVFVAKD